MEGMLYKWTNYMTGWQPRWFVLDNGIISYYDSQDDVCKGSKGSIKMSVCEIKVHPTDNTRLELIIPGEQHFYVKAVNAAERQKWLVALGSSKAGLIDTRTKKEKELTETTESLKTKMSELRLYCDLLMQQVHTIQESVVQDEDQTNSSTETMNEASSLLSATCNTFIKTLEDCMKIANSKFKTDLLQLTPPDPLMSPVSPSPIQMARGLIKPHGGFLEADIPGFLNPTFALGPTDAKGDIKMKRSISHPGTYSFDRSSHLPKDGLPPLPLPLSQRSSQRRTRTCSDTDAPSDSCTDETDRTVPYSKATVNGDSAPSIPEEMSANANRNTRSAPDMDTPESDLSL